MSKQQLGSCLESAHVENGYQHADNSYYTPIFSKPGQSSNSNSLEAGL